MGARSCVTNSEYDSEEQRQGPHSREVISLCFRNPTVSTWSTRGPIKPIRLTHSIFVGYYGRCKAAPVFLFPSSKLASLAMREDEISSLFFKITPTSLDMACSDEMVVMICGHFETPPLSIFGSKMSVMAGQNARIKLPNNT